MMKVHITAAVLCLALIFAFSAVNLYCLNSFVADCGDKIELVCDIWDEDDTIPAEKCAEELHSLWQKRKPWLESTIHHALIRDAEDAMTEFMLACGEDDKYELYRTASMLRTELEQIKELETLQIGNIL